MTSKVASWTDLSSQNFLYLEWINVMTGIFPVGQIETAVISVSQETLSIFFIAINPEFSAWHKIGLL